MSNNPDLKVFEYHHANKADGCYTYVAALTIVDALQAMAWRLNWGISSFDTEDTIKELDRSLWGFINLEANGEIETLAKNMDTIKTSQVLASSLFLEHD